MVVSQKRVIIVHGWEGSPDEPMHAWLQEELEMKGFSVKEPRMPHPEEPTIDDWIPHLAQIAGTVNENTFFIGHSIGCQTILRYLETLSPKIKIGGVVLIAPWMHLNETTFKEDEGAKGIAKPWIETPIDFEKVKSHTDKFVAIFSDDDQYVPLANKNIFEKKLNATTIVEHEMGHFDQASNVKEVPNILEAFLKIAA